MLLLYCICVVLYIFCVRLMLCCCVFSEERFMWILFWLLVICILMFLFRYCWLNLFCWIWMCVWFICVCLVNLLNIGMLRFSLMYEFGYYMVFFLKMWRLFCWNCVVLWKMRESVGMYFVLICFSVREFNLFCVCRSCRFILFIVCGFISLEVILLDMEIIGKLMDWFSGMFM